MHVIRGDGRFTVVLEWLGGKGCAARRLEWRRYIRFGLPYEPPLVEVWPSGSVSEWRPNGGDLLAIDWVLLLI